MGSTLPRQPSPHMSGDEGDGETGDSSLPVPDQPPPPPQPPPSTVADEVRIIIFNLFYYFIFVEPTNTKIIHTYTHTFY